MASYFEQLCEIFFSWFYSLVISEGATIHTPGSHSLLSFDQPALPLRSWGLPPSLPPSFPRWEEAVYPHWVWMMVASVLETSHKTDGMPSSCPRSCLATRRPMLHGAHHGLLLCWFSKAPEANGIWTGLSLLPAEAHPKAPLFLEPIPCSTSMEDSKEWKDSKAKASTDRQTKERKTAERKGYLRNSLEEKRSGKHM